MMMRNLVGAAFVAAAMTAACSAHAATYDCSKPGNATKITCKGHVIAAAKPVTGLKTRPGAATAHLAPSAAMVSAAKPAGTRTYDCAKPGNARLAICKGRTGAAVLVPTHLARPAAAVPLAPGGRVVTATQKNGKLVHYNCDKRGNLAKTACKN